MTRHPSSSLLDITTEIERTRARISRTLARLDRGYALRHLFVSTEHAVIGASVDAADLKKMVRKNGVPLAFIAIGLGWIAYGDRAGTKAVAHLAVLLGPLKNLAVEMGFLPRPEPAPPRTPHPGAQQGG